MAVRNKKCILMSRCEETAFFPVHDDKKLITFEDFFPNQLAKILLGYEPIFPQAIFFNQTTFVQNKPLLSGFPPEGGGRNAIFKSPSFTVIHKDN